MTTVEHTSRPRPDMVFPGFCAIRTLTCAALRFGSLLSPYHHEPLCSCSPPCLSVFSRWNHTRAENKATAHNRVVLGGENPHSWGAANQALGDAVATGVLGNLAIALCAVP